MAETHHRTNSRECSVERGRNVAVGSPAVMEALEPRLMLSADLAVVNISSPGHCAPGNYVSVDWTVENIGDEPTDSEAYWWDEVFLSTDAVWDGYGVDRWIGAGPDRDDPLNPGESYTVNESFRIPSSVEPGSYYLLALADVYSYVDSARDNNVLAVPFIVGSGDLVVTDITAPVSASLGESITVSWTVQNQGPGEIEGDTSWYDYLYLSGDATLNAEDVSLGSAYRKVALAEGASYIGSKTVTLNAVPESEGNYYLIVTADGGARLPEIDATNNASTVTIDIAGPDLIVDSWSGIPQTLSPRLEFDLSFVVENAGDLPVPSGTTWYDRVYYSTDDIWDRYSDSELALVTHNESVGLAVGGQYVVNAHIRLPQDDSNSSFLILVTDATYNLTELNDDNNVVVIALAITKPDLVVTGTSSPATAEPGESVDLSWTVENIGEGLAVPEWTDRVYWSSDEVLDATDRSVASKRYVSSLPLLAEGESYTFNRTVNLPSETLGAGWLLFSVDCPLLQPNEIFRLAESDETNNIVAVPLEVAYPPRADLVVTEVIVAEQVISGQPLQVTWTVTNTGEAEAPGYWTDQVVLSEDDDIGSLGNTISEGFAYSGASLAPGESVTRIQTLDIPIEEQGSYYLLVKTDSGNSIVETDNDNNVLSAGLVEVLLCSYPNLQVSDITVPAAPLSGQTIEVTWTVTNAGTGSTNAARWYDEVWLSQDDQLDTGENEDIYLGLVANVSYLDTGDSHVSSLLFTLPEDVEGTYHILVVTDIYHQVWEYEYDSDNFAAGGPFVIQPAPSPDLQVVSVTPPPVAFSTQTITVTWQVSNMGVAVTGSDEWIDGVYLSIDTELSDDDIRLGLTWHEGFLAAGETYEATASFVVPPEMHGDYYVLVATDMWVLDELMANKTPGAVYERAAETNNLTASTETVVIYLLAPDLEGDGFVVPSEAISGHRIEATYRTANRGTADTVIPTWTDEIYLSRDALWDVMDVKVGERIHRGGLGIDAVRTSVVSATLPEDAEGAYYVIVRLDASNRIGELDEDNNVLVSGQPIDVTFAAADLSLSLSGGAIVAGIDQTTWVRITVTNVGETDTVRTAWLEEFYLSADDQWSLDDTLVGEFNRSGLLNAGQSYTDMVQVEMPQWPWVLPGDYYLIAVADADDRVFEDDREANNVDAVPLTLTLQTPDLVTTNVIADAVVWSGQELNVQWTVQNTGPAGTGWIGWSDAVGLINVNDPGDTLFLEIVPSARSLGVGETYTSNAVFTLPRWISGEYYVRVMTDSPWKTAWTGSVIEVPSESNNTTTAAQATTIHFTPVPDLIVEDISVPVGAIAGQSVTLAWTLRNIGAGAVEADKYWMDAVYLSRDAVFDKQTDIYLGVASQVGAIAASGSKTTSHAFILPQGLTGLFYVFVTANVPVLNWNATSYLYESDSTPQSNRAVSTRTVLIRLAEPCDLVAGTIDIPANAFPGQSISLTYSVGNLGPNDAIGLWHDSLYLSADDTWDIGDVFVGRVEHVGTVAAGENYSETFIDVLPPVAPGSYKVIVRSDILNALPETDESNNAAASLLAVEIDCEALPLNGAVSGVLSAGEFVCYRVDATAGETVRLALDAADDSAMFEVYVAFERMPTRGDFDYLHGEPYQADQSVTIPTTMGGTYYVMVRAESAPADCAFDLSADVLAFDVTAVTPGSVGNAGSATVELGGAQFDPAMTCELIGSDGDPLAASAVHFQDAATVFATFDLEGRAIGAYDVRVTAPDGTSALLIGGLTVVEGQGAKLDVGLGVPFAVLVCPFSMRVEYANTGDADMLVPLLAMTGPAEAQLGLTLGATAGVGQLQLLGYSPSGPVNILRPGQREQIIVHCAKMEEGYYSFSVEGYTVGGDDAVIDWDALGRRYQPPYASDAEVWMANWRVFEAVAGETWSEVLLGLIDRLVESPFVGDQPNILVADIMSDLFAKSLGGGGGLTDTTPPYVIDHDIIADETGVQAVDLIFSEAINPADFPLDQVVLTGPSALSIEPLVITRVVDRLYRVSFPIQTETGEYRMVLGAGIRDRAGLTLDQNGNGLGGEATDGCAVTFVMETDGSVSTGPLTTALVAPAETGEAEGGSTTVVEGEPDASDASGSAGHIDGSDDESPTPITYEDPPELMEDNPAMTFTREALLADARVGEVNVSGTVHYTLDSKTPELSDRAAQVRIELWEQDGQRDYDPGEVTDQCDDLVAVINDETGSIYASLDGTFTYINDLQGLPLLNLDYDEVDPTNPTAPALAKYYIVIRAANPYAFGVQCPRVDRPNTTWVSLYPEGEPVGLTETDDRWADLLSAWSHTSPLLACDVSDGTIQLLRADSITIIPADMPLFISIESIRIAADWFLQHTGFERRPIAVIHIEHSNPDYGCHTRTDVIQLAHDARYCPQTAIHEYGHAMQVALAGYRDISYGGYKSDGTFTSGPYGLITESKSEEGTYTNTAFAEGWAVFFASAVTEGWQYEQNPGSTGSHERVDYNRSSQFLDTNDFWMGADAYGYQTSPSERIFNSSNLSASFNKDGVNDNASTGDLVLGGIASIFWDIYRNLGALYQLRIAMQGAPALTSSLMALYNAWPGAKRALDVIFIDHGVSVTDDAYGTCGGLGMLTETRRIDGLIMSCDGANEHDTFTFSLPAISWGEPKTYTSTISINFDKTYGDLDLVVEKRDGNGNIEIQKDVVKGGSVARVRLSGLKSNESYAITVKVYGHGAFGYGDGFGGDFHPDYALVISPNLPTWLETEDPNYPPGDGPQPGGSDEKKVWVTEPWDPNDILGPAGYGPLNWLAADSTMEYTIRFENYATATAAARQVVVTQQLDEDLDWRSFRVGDFGFGATWVSVEADRTFYSGRIDATDAIGVYVDAYVALDIHTGQVTFSLTAIDPTTGQMTMDPALGLLLPEDGTGCGQGFFTYSIRPKDDVVTGTVIDAKATITFDTQPPIDTPEISHTLDADKPSASVELVDDVAITTAFTASWSAADAPGGSGLAAVDVYVSDNGGSWEMWQQQATFSAAPFIGESGHTYSFCTIASDNAGNIEQESFIAEDKIDVWDAGIPPTVESVTVNDGSIQRSMVWDIKLLFDQPVFLDAGALSLISEAGTPVGTLTTNPSGDQRTYLITFTDPAVIGGSLPDGWYRMSARSAKVTNLGELPMTEDNIFEFFRLFGDVDGDRDVDRSDYIQIRGTLNKSDGQAGFNSAFDYDGNGLVDDIDVGEIRSRLNTWLDEPAFPEPTTTQAQTLATSVAEPQIESVMVNDGAAQRSMVSSLTVTFDQAVQTSPAAFVLTRSDGLTVDLSVSNPSGDGRTFVLTFDGPGIVGGSLADGLYSLTVCRNLLIDLGGNSLTGEDDTFSFHRFYGDWNGDLDVDFTDVMGLIRTYGSRSGLRTYDIAFDYDGDGDVDIFDVMPMIYNYRKTLT